MSSSGLVRRAWELLWRNPSIFNLVFWSLILSLAVDLVFQSRLSHYLPPAFLHPRLGMTAGQLALHLPPGGAVRLGLFMATLLLIVTPYRLAGLYGGAGQLIRKRGVTVGYWLLFFEAGWRLFWRGLTATLGALALALVLVLLALGLSLLGTVAGAFGLLLLIPWVVLFVWSIGFALMGLGAVMANDRPVQEAISFSWAWARVHWQQALRLGLLLGGLFLAAMLVLLLLAGIPVLGSILGLLGLWLLNAVVAVLPTVLYDEAATTRPA
jgi:hypothetical protein